MINFPKDTIRRCVYAFLVLCLFTISVSAQEAKFDKLTKINGELMEVKVTAIGDDVVTYNFPNESLTYTISTSDITKIEFASGRVQVFSDPADAASNNQVVQSTSAPAVKMDYEIGAVLPVSFINQNEENAIVGNRAQVFLYQQISSKSAFRVQNIGTTNNLLKAQGIDESNVANFSAQDLAAILGVGFLI